MSKKSFRILAAIAQDSVFTLAGANSTPTLKFPLATTTTAVKQSTGEVIDQPAFLYGTMLGGTASYANDQGLLRGQIVLVEGEYEQSEYTDEAGVKHNPVNLKVLSLTKVAASSSYHTVTDKNGGVRLMNGRNEAVIHGNLTKDVVVGYTPSGDAYAQVSLAINDGYKQNGARVETVDFVNATLWRDAALAVEGCKKGQPMLIEGRTISEKTTIKGIERRVTKVEGHTVTLFERPMPKANSARPAVRPTARPAPAMQAAIGD